MRRIASQPGMDRLEQKISRIDEELRLRDFDTAQKARNAWAAYVIGRRYSIETTHDKLKVAPRVSGLTEVAAWLSNRLVDWR